MGSKPRTLRVALEVAETQAEGPGDRYAIWVQGCTLRCPGCCNPEMFADRGGTVVEVDALVERIVATPKIEGVTMLGGEPMQQAPAVAELLSRVRARGLSTMVFTGYTREELAEVDGAAEVLPHLDLLVDGRYDATAPDETRRWIGSENQRMHFLTDRYDPDDPMFTASDTVELRMRDGVLTINGRPWGGWAPRGRR